MTALRDALALRRLDVMRRRSAEQQAKRRRPQCDCAFCTAAKSGRVLSLADVLAALAGQQQPAPDAGTTTH